MVAFIVGPTGLPTRVYSDWRTEVVTRMQAAYGPDIDVDPQTPDGLIVDTFALQDQQLGDAISQTQSNSFFRTASGAYLDLMLDPFNRKRLAATSSTVAAVWYGNAASVVWDGITAAPVASILSTGVTNGDRYLAAEAATLPALNGAAATFVVRILEATATNTYAVEIAAVDTDVVASTSVTLTTASELATEIETDHPTITTTVIGDGGTGALIVCVKTGSEAIADGSTTTTPAEMEVHSAISVAMSAESTGPQIVLSGLLTVLATPPSGISGVVNLLDGTTGRDVETDAAFRVRHIDQINVGGKATSERIRGALLDQSPVGRTALDLTSVRIFNNRTGDVDARGLPAHSFEVVVLGDATDAEVAAVIFDYQPAGIESQGTLSELVADELGVDQEVRFSRATVRYLHLAIEVTDGEGYPTVGDPLAAIGAEVLTYLNATLTMGQDLYRYGLRGPIGVAVPIGIVSDAITTDDTPLPGDTPTLTASDITVADDEILVADSSRIVVTLAP